MPNFEENKSAHCKTIFKQTFKFTKSVPEQRLSPEGFLIRDCGCVMRFLPNLDNKLNKIKLQPSPSSTIKNQNTKNNTLTVQKPTNLNQTKITSTEMNNTKNIGKKIYFDKFERKRSCNFQPTSLYRSTFWMEPRVVPVKYTTEVNFDLDSSIKRFTEQIDLQMKLVPCPYIQQIGTTTRYKTTIETKIQPAYTLPLDTTI
ncbi:Hypothetical protein CINCED_3A001968 [Cinara cedri]|uniref:Uncharacterized protein n=1 Tax=Cinara cedri TaxID=506608 RepID=A0A5E4MP35_9HEMI|nr:Hypothetical protein CINCED_3A001968 [Cinara cedri]